MANGFLPLYPFTQKRLAAFLLTLREMGRKAVFPLSAYTVSLNAFTVLKETASEKIP
jgi:hypothetical protein